MSNNIGDEKTTNGVLIGVLVGIALIALLALGFCALAKYNEAKRHDAIVQVEVAMQNQNRNADVPGNAVPQPSAPPVDEPINQRKRPPTNPELNQPEFMTNVGW